MGQNVRTMADSKPPSVRCLVIEANRMVRERGHDTQVHPDLGIAYFEMGLIDDAIAEMEDKSGSILDPKLVTAFKEILPEVLEVKEKYSDAPEIKC